MMKQMLVVALALAAGCSKKSGDGGGDKPSVDLAAAANAKVPAAVQSVLKFETRTIKDDDYKVTVAAPVGWTSENKMFAGRLKPPSGAKDLGFMTVFSIGTDCNGSCEPKDWKSVIAKLAPQNVPDGPDMHTEALPNNGVIRWSTGKDKAAVYAAWYKDGAKNFKTCSINLDNPQLASAVDAFVTACKTAQYD